MDCDWNHPGVDPYTGTARTAIMAFVTIPEPVRQVLVERVERRDYDDIVYIDRDSIVGIHYEYAAELTSMHFGSKGKQCERVTRSGWDDKHTESAMVFCEQGYCVARPSVCNNWALVRRTERTEAMATFETIVADAGEFAAISPLPATLPPAAQENALPDVPGLFLTPVYVSVPSFVPVYYAPPGVTPPIPEPPVWWALAGGLYLLYLFRKQRCV